MVSSKAGVLIVAVVVLISSFLFVQIKDDDNDFYSKDYEIIVQSASASAPVEVTGIVKKHETIYDIFRKNELDVRDINALNNSSRKIFNLKRIRPGRSYVIIADSDRRVKELKYAINDHSFLDITRTRAGIESEIKKVAYEKKTGFITGVIRDNLFSSLGANSEYIRIAYDLSDVFAWDIDFMTDLRKGDSFKIAVEELWVGDVFKGFGEIISAEFSNNGSVHKAYRFSDGTSTGYYDAEGRSLRKSLLRAPLNFRYISSAYSKKRLHPILKRYRPHLGVDYVAPSGTPVSASGDGRVVFAGRKGQNGKLIIIKHNAGYTTYYGHLKGFARKIRKGRYVKQGQVIGYVGRTGLATGPHLDYRIKHNGRFVNPRTVSLPRSSSVPDRFSAEYADLSQKMQALLDSIGIYDFAVVRTEAGSV